MNSRGRGITTAAAVLAVSVLAAPAFAGDQNNCKTVVGKAEWTLIPPTNPPATEPLGRVLGPATGDLKAAVTAYLTGLTPNATFSEFHATSVETWSTGAQDLLLFAGDATFTAIPDQPVGTVADSLTLTVIGGSGKYAGATGTVYVTGTGYNLFGPNAGPGSTFFDVRYRGQICTQ
jgi:hypothetical protein